MATAPAGFVVDLNDNDDGSTAIGLRRAFALLFKQASPGVAVAGRLGDDHFVVTGDATAMKYHVSGGGVLIVRNPAGGAYVVGVPQGFTLDAPPVDGVNPRIDRIYVRQPDPALDGSGTAVNFVVDVASGIPAANPQSPALPEGSLELARKRVAADATNTASGAAFTNMAPVTGLNVGGILPLSQGGTGASTPVAALQNLGIFVQATQPPYVEGRVWIKVP